MWRQESSGTKEEDEDDEEHKRDPEMVKKEIEAYNNKIFHENIRVVCSGGGLGGDDGESEG